MLINRIACISSYLQVNISHTFTDGFSHHFPAGENLFLLLAVSYRSLINHYYLLCFLTDPVGFLVCSDRFTYQSKKKKKKQKHSLFIYTASGEWSSAFSCPYRFRFYFIKVYYYSFQYHLDFSECTVHISG